MLRSQPDEFYSLVFGGPARLGRLRACLAALSEAGATMLILSNGIEEEIEAALAHIGVRNRFAAVLGGESPRSHSAPTRSASPRSSQSSRSNGWRTRPTRASFL